MKSREVEVPTRDGETVNQRNRIGEIFSNVRDFIGDLTMRTIFYLRPIEASEMPFSDDETLREEARRHTIETIQ